ncbi:uncharacterized protein DNG_02184 [Cephalotrichum gorgonifer]|uniref:Uncharacterized protein n=1 Tax=Cephalotrichum gorgonifer TaxID=2041049 RepID=A0AAE8SSF7_9PEZI|nr:uncharacterized protein DNG_02184 [Cephalotrichum gorgonifer]
MAKKTELLAATSLYFMSHPNIGRIYCSAPTQNTTTAFAKRLYQMGMDVTKRLNICRPFVVRGYTIEAEVTAFLKIVCKDYKSSGRDPYYPSDWDLNLSATEWLLKVARIGSYQLSQADIPPLHELREQYLANGRYEMLRQLFEGKIGSDEEDVKNLLKKVIMEADAVCTIPRVAGEIVYSDFNEEQAKGTIMDVAGRMHQADALLL